MSDSPLITAIVALGSNLDDPKLQVERAFIALGSLPATQLVKRSSLYRSAPQGPQDQDDYINAAAALQTRLTAKDLLLALQQIEQDFGRVKTRHWGERVIDLDIIFYGNQNINLNEPALIIPHAHALQRDFVLKPILEMYPDYLVSDGSSLSSHYDKCATHLLDVI